MKQCSHIWKFQTVISEFPKKIVGFKCQFNCGSYKKEEIKIDYQLQRAIRKSEADTLRMKKKREFKFTINLWPAIKWLYKKLKRKRQNNGGK